MMKTVLSLPLVFLLAFLLLPGAGTLAAEAQRVGYVVDLTRAAEGVITVTMEMDAVSRPLVLEMPDTYANGLAAGLSSHIVEEVAVDASGQELPVSRNGNTWSIDHVGGLSFSYSLRLRDYETESPYLDSLAGSGPPWPYFPLLDEDLAYLPGYAVFVRPAGPGYAPSLELRTPPGWEQLLPWAQQPSDLDDLLFNPIYAGELLVQEEGSLVIAIPAGVPAAGSMAEYAGKARALLEKAEGLLGGLDLAAGKRPVLSLLFHGGDGLTEELYYPSSPFSASIVIPASADGDLLSDATIAATARGMASLLLYRSLDVEPEALWLREGSSWYLQDLLPYEAGLWGANLFWDRFYLGFDTYRAARAGSELSMARAGALGYDSEGAAVALTRGGAVACASFDSELRSQPYALDLATFLRNLGEMEGSEVPLGNADILAALNNLTGRDWSAFFQDHIEGSAEIPASAFSSLNIVEPGGAGLPLETPEANTSTSDWIFLAMAVFVVLLIPFVLEPYTMRPRKPGFLERELAKDDED